MNLKLFIKVPDKNDLIWEKELDKNTPKEEVLEIGMSTLVANRIDLNNRDHHWSVWWNNVNLDYAYAYHRRADKAAGIEPVVVANPVVWYSVAEFSALMETKKASDK